MAERFYTGIGSRETPKSILALMEEIAFFLCDARWVLRSGAAPGADSAFERGALLARPRYGGANRPIQVWLPWPGFEDRPEGNGWDYLVGSSKDTEIAERFHPAWDKCSQGARKLHTRNVGQILGQRIVNYGSENDPDPEVYEYREPKSRFVICWTEGGRGQGGTGQALRIARHYGVPIFDLGLPKVEARLREASGPVAIGGRSGVPVGLREPRGTYYREPDPMNRNWMPSVAS